jgi:hypothetical protein
LNNWRVKCWKTLPDRDGNKYKRKKRLRQAPAVPPLCTDLDINSAARHGQLDAKSHEKKMPMSGADTRFMVFYLYKWSAQRQRKGALTEEKLEMDTKTQ